MSQIQVNHRTIQSSNANFNVQLATPYTAAFAGYVQDSSTQYLEAASDTIQKSTENLGESIKNFTDYINSVAEYFKSKDSTLAKEISSVTVRAVPSSKQQAAQKKQQAKTSTTYKILP